MTTAARIIERLKSGPATAEELGFRDISLATVQRTVTRMCLDGSIKPIGTRKTGKRGSRPYVYAVAT